MKPETQDPLSTFVPPLFGDKSSPPSREGRLAGLKELKKAESLTGKLRSPSAGVLGTQLSPAGMGNASSVPGGRRKEPVGLQGRGVCLPLF